jgi:hypothetical protein
VSNCDEFIFYDDLVGEREKKPQAGDVAQTARAPVQGRAQEQQEEGQEAEAIDLVVETVEALFAERGDQDKIWGSMVKQALKRRKPGFNESYYGFRSFSRVLEEARDKNLLELELDEKSGSYIIKNIIHEE